MKAESKTWFASHSHSWIVIVAASILAIILINWLPTEKVFSSILIGLIVSHLLILLTASFAGWLLLPEKFLKKFKKKDSEKIYDFGWSTKWINGFGFASFIVFLLAFYSFFALSGSLVLQMITFTILLLLAINLFIGNIVAKTSKSKFNLVLPYVNLFKEGKDKVLDAGCGSGRTTISLSKANPNLQIVAFDRFDASYIENGGKSLLENNIKLAGISSQITIEKGDITAMPFPENYFDAAVSSYVFDHLGNNKLKALQEIWRVLKPGGRFLLVIMVRGYSTFAFANILGLIIAPRKLWRNLFNQSGLKLVDEGNINFGAYFLVEK